MVVVYWDPVHEKWHAGTRSVSEADLPIRTGHMEIGDMTFSELFFLALKRTTGDLADSFDKELTYVFELTSPYNRIVVKYDEPKVTLLAARHTASGRELHIDVVPLHIPRPKTWSLNSPEAIDAFVNTADPAVLEGAVVCDSQFRRLKIKNKAYVLSSKAKDLVTVSRRSALEAIITGTIDDVLPLIEVDIANELRQMQGALRQYIKRVDNNFATWKAEAMGNRKSFAELVRQSGSWASPYFQLIDAKGTDTLDWLVKAQAAGRLSPKALDTVLKEMMSFTSTIKQCVI
jgi:hypothetical protein